MKAMTFGAAAVLAPALAIGAAPPPAQAEVPTLAGVYLYADEDGDTGTWAIRTTCTPDCVAHVTTSSGRSFDAALVDGRYTNTRTIPGGVVCPGTSGHGHPMVGPGNPGRRSRLLVASLTAVTGSPSRESTADYSVSSSSPSRSVSRRFSE